MTKIGIILGSTRPGRNGEAVAKWVLDVASKRSDAEFELVYLLDNAGCYAPRRIPTSWTLSLHAWGLAVDLNASRNPQGQKPHQDLRLVHVMERHGFWWGGRWPTVPDGIHFEYHGDGPPSADEQRRLLRDQMAEHNALGITGVTEPGLSPGQIESYTELWHAGELTTRAHLLWRIAGLADVDAAVEAFEPRVGDDMLRFDGLKYLSDGGVEGGFLRDPYQIVP